MSIASELASLGTQINAGITHCNEALVAKGVTGAGTLWEVGDRIGEIVGGLNNDVLIDLIEGDITELEIPDGATQIYSYALFGRDLISVTIPASVTRISLHAFESCLYLSSVIFGEDSNLSSIGESAFYLCTALTSIKMPFALQTIEKSAFGECYPLTSLILPRTTSVVTLKNSNALYSTKIESGSGYIYVPRALLSSYQSATNWSTYSSRFRAIEDYPEITGG